MTFKEWTATYCNGMLREGDTAEDRLTRLIASEAWRAAEAATREEMFDRWNRTGIDIDAALHGRVNKESPIANRLRMIAAAQPQWLSADAAPKDGTPFLAHWDTEALPVVASFRDGDFRGLDGDSDSMTLLGWIPLPPAPEKTTTGEQEDRDVT